MKCNINRENKEKLSGDPRLREIYENLDRLKIGPDEPFKFHCTMCGKCCIHREDILLTPKDLFGIAKELGTTPDKVIRDYCDTYVGGTSRFPIVRLNPVGADRHCPLLKDNKCSVHKVKPVVCAMFPIGRAISAEGDALQNDGITPDKIQYIFVDPGCGDDAETHTVREWFGEFGISMEDEFFIRWQRALNALSMALIRLEKKLNADMMRPVWNVVYAAMYLNYDMNNDFMEQFSNNAEKIIELIKKIEAEGLEAS